MNTQPLRLREILRVAREARASDVHLSAVAPVALRVDGLLELRRDCVVSANEIDETVARCFDEQARTRLMSSGDATTSYDDKDSGRARIHAYRAGGTYSLAIRMLALDIPPLDTLCLPSSAIQLAALNHGLVIITGPTGSGKSTVLAAIVDRINRTSPKHIITIEDPIEYQHTSQASVISQREIGYDAISFSGALLGALRSDPDVILVGEMRECSTMQAAVSAAETGHLVLCTMHTGSAAESIDRIIGSFDGAAQSELRMQLAETLAGVVCLRLVPRRVGFGRIAAAEILIGTDAVRSAIRESKGHHLRNIIATSRTGGMQTLEAHLNDLVARGEIALEQALRATDRPEEVRSPEQFV